MDPIVLQTKEYNVYVLVSSECTEKIFRNLQKASEREGDLIHVSPLKSSSQQGQDKSTKNKFICRTSMLKRIIEMNPSYATQIEDYEWISFPTPKPQEGELRNVLHISGLPMTWDYFTTKEFISDELKYICKFGEREDKDKDYTLDVPLSSREGKGVIRGFIDIRFEDHVDIYNIYLCKIILHHRSQSVTSQGMTTLASNIFAKWHVPYAYRKRKAIEKKMNMDLNNFISEAVPRNMKF